MGIDLDITCDCCQQSIERDGETYCGGCWSDTCATLPGVEKALRELAKTLQDDAAKQVERLAERIYDWHMTPDGRRGPPSSDP